MNKSQQQSSVMKAAASAATKVSSWSDAKKTYATKVSSSGSYKAQSVDTKKK